MEKTKDSKPVILETDPTRLLQNADAFKRISDNYIQKVKVDNQILIKDSGGLIVAATNLGLAVELYLKALLLLVNHKIPTKHHLWHLFADLPQDFQNSIRDNYDRNYNNPACKGSIGLEVQNSSTPRPDAEITKGKLEKKGHDLDTVLKGSSEMFTKWRYMHESGVKGKQNLHRFDYGSINLICDTVRFHALERVKQVEENRTQPAPTLS